MILKSPTNLALRSQPNRNLAIAEDCFDQAHDHLHGILNHRLPNARLSVNTMSAAIGLASTYAGDGAYETAIDIANQVHAMLQQRRPVGFTTGEKNEAAIDLIIVGIVALKAERDRRERFIR